MSGDQFRTPRGPRKPSDRGASQEAMRQWATREFTQSSEEPERTGEDEFADDRQAAIEEMVEWFFANFEDPANQTPRDDGEFVYIWGGPFDAREMIGDHFGGQHNDEWIEAAIDAVQESGTYDWAPTSEGDFHAASFEDAATTSEGEGLISRGDLVRRLEGRLNDLERRLDEIPVSPKGLGHNRPPSDIGLPPYDENDKKELSEAAESARLEIIKDDPDVDRLSNSASTFRRTAAKIGFWLAQKADLAVDEAIKAGIKVGALVALANLLQHIATDLVHLVGKIIGFQ